MATLVDVIESTQITTVAEQLGLAQIVVALCLGTSWRSIAGALVVSGQAVHKKVREEGRSEDPGIREDPLGKFADAATTLHTPSPAMEEASTA